LIGGRSSEPIDDYLNAAAMSVIIHLSRPAILVHDGSFFRQSLSKLVMATDAIDNVVMDQMVHIGRWRINSYVQEYILDITKLPA